MLLTEVANFSNMVKMNNATSVVASNWDKAATALRGNVPTPSWSRWNNLRPQNALLAAETRPTSACSARSLLCDGSPVYLDNPANCVTVVCSNPTCNVSRWMHTPCFIDWEKLVFSHANDALVKLHSSSQQRFDEVFWRATLWTDGKYSRIRDQVCACPCGMGYRKRLHAAPNKSVAQHTMHAQLMHQSEPHGSQSSTIWNPPLPHPSGSNAMLANGQSGYSVGHPPMVGWESVGSRQQWHAGDFGMTLPRSRLFSLNGAPEPPFGARGGIVPDMWMCTQPDGPLNPSVKPVETSRPVECGMVDVFNYTPYLRQRAASIGSTAATIPHAKLPNHSEKNRRATPPNGKPTDPQENLSTSRGSLNGSPTQVPSANTCQRQASSNSTGSNPGSDGPLVPLGSDPSVSHRVVRGNIFQQRTPANTDQLRARVRHWNGYEVQLADDAQYGKDRLRTHVLVALSAVKMTTMQCVVCSVELDVFQDFPLIDGLFFESPIQYNCGVKVEPLSVGGLHRAPLTDASRFYLNAICLDCLMGKTHEVRCKSCKTAWNGSVFILGHVYLYDVFAAMPCCDARLACKGCDKPACGKAGPPAHFSQFSELVVCGHCGLEDHHYAKPLYDMFERVAKC